MQIQIRRYWKRILNRDCHNLVFVMALIFFGLAHPGCSQDQKPGSTDKDSREKSIRENTVFLPGKKYEIEIADWVLPDVDLQQAAKKYGVGFLTSNKQRVYEQILIRAGDKAIPIISAHCKELKVDMTAMVSVLTKLGKPGVKVLTELANDNSRDPILRLKAVWHLKEMGPMAAPAVNDLVDFYFETDSPKIIDTISEIGVWTPRVEKIITYVLEMQKYKMLHSYPVYRIQKLKVFGPNLAPLVPLLQKYLDPEKIRTRFPEKLPYTYNNERNKEGIIIGTQDMLIDVLGEIGPAAGTTAKKIAEILKKRKERFRIERLAAFGKMGESASAAVPFLIEELRKPRWQDKDKIVIVESLGKIGTKASAALPEIQKFIEHLKQEDLKQYQVICRVALYRINDEPEECIAYLKKSLTQAIGFRAEALLEIGKLGPQGKKLVPELVNIITTSNKYGRHLAIEALGNLENHGANGLDALIWYINRHHMNPDKKSEVVKAIEAMGKINSDERVLRGLNRLMLHSQITDLRWMARFWVRRIDR